MTLCCCFLESCERFDEAHFVKSFQWAIVETGFGLVDSRVFGVAIEIDFDGGDELVLQWPRRERAAIVVCDEDGAGDRRERLEHIAFCRRVMRKQEKVVLIVGRQLRVCIERAARAHATRVIFTAACKIFSPKKEHHQEVHQPLRATSHNAREETFG